MSEGRGHRACISRCESRCVVGAPSPFTKGQSVPEKPQMLHVCSGTFSPGIGISTWNTHSSVRPSTVEDLHGTWSPCSLWDLKYIESRGIHCPSEVCTWFK